MSTKEMALRSSHMERTVNKCCSLRTIIIAGLREVGVDGEYEWTDKSAVNYVNWGPSQPDDNNNTDNCVTSDNLWNDRLCIQPVVQMCQFGE